MDIHGTGQPAAHKGESAWRFSILDYLLLASENDGMRNIIAGHAWFLRVPTGTCAFCGIMIFTDSFAE
jgi:hypothetical protein